MQKSLLKMESFRNTPPQQPPPPPTQITKNIKQQILLQIPECTVHLMDNKGEPLELARGKFTLIQILDKNIPYPVATIIKVGDDLQWPLTRDEPVLKLDRFHYLFSLLIKDGHPLNYGLAFPQMYGLNLGPLDSLLKENSCFSGVSSSKSKNVEWEQFGSRIDDYNRVLVNAIADGSGQIVRGIFVCSNAYSSRVHNGGEIILSSKKDKKDRMTRSNTMKMKNGEDSGLRESLKRARNLSKMTENISKAVLDGVVAVTGILMSSLLYSQAGKAFLCTPTGQILLASLDALNAIMEAIEVAGKQALSATSSATTRMVTDKRSHSRHVCNCRPLC
ncbi:senescence/dehydration-associated protein At4g35985, chloroplastic-like isoform X2 [Euphorbia lathyris]|uniref:senescence/dehydration-associated protein At4g35985, chloroplastic-like isoform X2 n=1 Tax=Euphorbia lathyris TaxID=212925 RepID=UPI0033139D80